MEARLDRRGLDRTAEGAPSDCLPGLATAHRARLELAADRDRLAAIHAAVLTFCVIAGGQERPLIATGGCGRTFPGCRHPDPLIRQHVNLTMKMPILPPWPPRNPSPKAA